MGSVVKVLISSAGSLGNTWRVLTKPCWSYPFGIPPYLSLNPEEKQLKYSDCLPYLVKVYSILDLCSSYSVAPLGRLQAVLFI